MWFTAKVKGPLDLGAMMVAFVEVQDRNGNLFNPEGVVALVSILDSDLAPVELKIGSKGPGKCEYAPIVADGRVYKIWLADENGQAVSETALLDTALPIASAISLGFIHKSFIVCFQAVADVPPPPPDCEHCPRLAELEHRLEAMSEHVQAAIEELTAALAETETEDV